jgi:hypothetical protein
MRYDTPDDITKQKLIQRGDETEFDKSTWTGQGVYILAWASLFPRIVQGRGSRVQEEGEEEAR